MVLRTLWFYFCWQIRPFVKWFLRKTTRLCELQRICYGTPSGYARSSGVEQSLNLSKNNEIKCMIDGLDALAEVGDIAGPNHKTALEFAVATVLRAKKIKPTLHKPFVINFSRCVEHIWGYKQLFYQVERIRLMQYDCSNSDHEEKLLRLWKGLKPDQVLESRITKQWQDIGFQGDDPKTDFRGMGMLGLENLLYFVVEYNAAASHVLSHSLHPQYGYAFAIVGINITSMAYSLLKDGIAKTHIYNLCKSMPSQRVFHQMYCYLFYEFDRYWIASKPKDVMEFSFIKDKFEKNMRTLLLEPGAVFSIDFVVDTV